MCHELRRPKVDPYTRVAIELWQIVADDRVPGFSGVSTVMTSSMISVCEAYGAGWGDLLKMKTIERVYFSRISKKADTPKPQRNEKKGK